MTLPTNYVDGNVIHGSDVDSWTTAINAVTNAIAMGTVSGLTATATAAGTTTLTIGATQIQKFTGTTTQVCKLPTTSVVVGNWWLIINESTGVVTVEASGGGSISALAGGTAGFFFANGATPTTAAGWDAVLLITGAGSLPVASGGTGASSLSGLVVGNGTSAMTAQAYSTSPAASTVAEWDANVNLSANNMIQGWTTTASTSSGTLTMSITSAQIQQITGSHDYTVKLPTTSVGAGMTYYIFNTQASNVVAVQASGAGAIVTLAANTSGRFTANVATPTTAAGWDAYYYGVTVSSGKNPVIQNSVTFAGTDGTVMTFPGTSDTVVTLAATQTQTNKTLTTPAISSPALSGTATGTYTLGGTPTISSPTVNTATVTGYTETLNALGTVTSSKTIPALSNGTVLTATLTASTACTFTMPSVAAGQSFVLLLKQAASTGGGTAVFTGVKWNSLGTPTQTATAATMDIYTFVSDGTDWYGSYSQGYTP